MLNTLINPIDSEVSDYPVYIDTCASDIYTPMASNLDTDSSHVHTRVTDRLNLEQADGIGKFAGAPAYVMPNMSDTLLGGGVFLFVAQVIGHTGKQLAQHRHRRKPIQKQQIYRGF